MRNEPSYSDSKFNTLFGEKACARRAYYAWYAMWDGWWYGSRPPRSEAAEAAYKAKFYTTAPAYAGNVVHDTAEFVLRNAKSAVKADVSLSAMLNRAQSRITRDIMDSKFTGQYNPKTSVKFLAHRMGQEVNEEWIRERVESSIRALYSDNWETPFGAHNLFLRAAANPSRIVSVEDLISFEAGGIKCFIKIDLMTRNPQDPESANLVDWKTGKEREAVKGQMVTYRAWSKKKGWANLRMFAAYVGNEPVRVNEVEIEDHEADMMFAERIHKYVEAIKRRIVDGDLQQNVPIEALWEPTTNASSCSDCPFSIICQRDGTKPR